jgi:hypothetical protein
MTFTTSYKSEGLPDLMTNLIRCINPSLVLEFGVQQGASLISIAKGLKNGKVIGYDLFEPNYDEAPFGQTHANKSEAEKNVSLANVGKKVEIFQANVFEIWTNYEKVDVLHVDICNYYKNILLVLEQWSEKVDKMILLEGGDDNHWHKKYNFRPFHSVLHMDFITRRWEHTVIRGENDYALTVLTRRKYGIPI